FDGRRYSPGDVARCTHTICINVTIDCICTFIENLKKKPQGRLLQLFGLMALNKSVIKKLPRSNQDHQIETFLHCFLLEGDDSLKFLALENYWTVNWKRYSEKERIRDFFRYGNYEQQTQFRQDIYIMKLGDILSPFNLELQKQIPTLSPSEQSKINVVGTLSEPDVDHEKVVIEQMLPPINSISSELKNTYFATDSMVASKIQPRNVYGESIGQYPYLYLNDQMNSSGKWKIKTGNKNIITKVSINDIADILERNEQTQFVRLIKVSQEIRELFSKKRQDQDIYNVLISNVDVNNYRALFINSVKEIKHEYIFNITLTLGLMCAIFFGTSYLKTKGMCNNILITTIFLMNSELLGTVFMYQFYQWAQLYVKYGVLAGEISLGVEFLYLIMRKIL
ncbi:MAG TPA: hypothetical protein VL201_02360, partial [Patescibacteria group bacterium]|nr:hypothetical protein [Patescibacteria group bacterium]